MTWQNVATVAAGMITAWGVMTWQQAGPDWGPIGTTVAALITALGGAFAVWNTWFKQRGDAHKQREDAQKNREDAQKDRSELTLDGVFRLVNELQDEVVRKAAEYAALDKRCNDRIEALEERISVLEIALRAR